MHEQIQRIGFIIPEFPQQTHIAWWRVSKAMGELGKDVHLISTRRPDEPCPHQGLVDASNNTTYLWPPSIRDFAAYPVVLIRHARSILSYRSSLAGFSGKRWFRFYALLCAAVRLKRLAAQRRLDHIFVHSCADAAYVVALSRLIGGPSYSLRLGGDLEVYGTDHKAKMKQASIIVAAAAPYLPRLEHEVGLEPEQLMWSWVGTDTTLFRPNEKSDKSDSFHIVTVARLNPAKGYQFILPAVAKLREHGFVFCYTIVGEGKQRQSIEKQIIELGLEDCVELAGALSAEQIASLHASADLFVLPTSGVGEGTPAAVCEAMSAGLPVVATEVGGLRDMIEDGVHGLLVPPGDSESLFQAIERFASGDAALSGCSHAARERAVQHFSVQAVADTILQRIQARMDA